MSKGHTHARTVVFHRKRGEFGVGFRIRPAEEAERSPGGAEEHPFVVRPSVTEGPGHGGDRPEVRGLIRDDSGDSAHGSFYFARKHSGEVSSMISQGSRASVSIMSTSQGSGSGMVSK